MLFSEKNISRTLINVMLICTYIRIQVFYLLPFQYIYVHMYTGLLFPEDVTFLKVFDSTDLHAFYFSLN